MRGVELKRLDCGEYQSDRRNTQPGLHYPHTPPHHVLPDDDGEDSQQRSPMLSVTDAWESGGETTQGFLPHLSRPRPKEGRTDYSRHHHLPKAEFCSCSQLVVNSKTLLL